MTVPDSETRASITESLAKVATRTYHLFNEHPKKNRMNYCTHMIRSLYMSARMAKGSIALLIHSFCPFWFETTGSKTIEDLDEEIQNHKLSLSTDTQFKTE
jgi:hypothetical protein